jgi:hypothetical protein
MRLFQSCPTQEFFRSPPAKPSAIAGDFDLVGRFNPLDFAWTSIYPHEFYIKNFAGMLLSLDSLIISGRYRQKSAQVYGLAMELLPLINKEKCTGREIT